MLDSGSAGFGYGIALMFMGFLAAASGHGTSVIIGAVFWIAILTYTLGQAVLWRFFSIQVRRRPIPGVVIGGAEPRNPRAALGANRI